MSAPKETTVHAGGGGESGRPLSSVLAAIPVATSSSPGESRARPAAGFSTTTVAGPPPAATEPRARDGDRPHEARQPDDRRRSRRARGRQGAADADAITSDLASPPGETIPAGAAEEEGADERLSPGPCPPLSPDAPAGGEGAADRDPSTGADAPPLADTIATIVELTGRRRFLIVSQVRLSNALGAFVRRMLGWRVELPQAQRDAIAREAARMIKAIEKGAPVDHPRAADIAALVLATASARQPFDALRDACEAEMRRLARATPAHGWVKSVAGFGDLGLGVIVGEAGDIGTYATPSRLWKRLGLAVIEGERQQRRSDPDLAAKHGFNPRRRAEVFAFLQDALFRQQWRGEKDGVPAHAIAPYGEVYGAKKAEYLERGWTPGHADSAARRYMAKRIVLHLWREWRRAIGTPDTVIGAPEPRPPEGPRSAAEVSATTVPSPPPIEGSASPLPASFPAIPAYGAPAAEGTGAAASRRAIPANVPPPPRTAAEVLA